MRSNLAAGWMGLLALVVLASCASENISSPPTDAEAARRRERIEGDPGLEGSPGSDADAAASRRASPGMRSLPEDEATRADAAAGATAESGALPASPTLDEEEIWYFARSTTPSLTPRVSLRAAGEHRDALPLESIAVEADVRGGVARVRLEERFHSGSTETREVTLELVLPEDAALDELVLRIGERRIRGIVKERSRAARLFQLARARGHDASLLVESEDGVYRQHLGAVEPGRRVDLRLGWFQGLLRRGDQLELPLPLAVEGDRPVPVRASVRIAANGSGAWAAREEFRDRELWTATRDRAAGPDAFLHEGLSSEAPSVFAWRVEASGAPLVSCERSVDGEIFVDVLLADGVDTIDGDALPAGLGLDDIEDIEVLRAPGADGEAGGDIVRVRGRVRPVADGAESRWSSESAFETVGLAALWARQRVRRLEPAAVDDPALAAELLRLGLAHGIVSSRTALVLIDTLAGR